MTDLLVREFQPGDETAFRDLNVAWIQALFEMEPKDYEVLDHPGKYILEPGGWIVIAERDGIAVGCCALVVHGPGCRELSKMAVAESERGKGVGRRILEFAIQLATERGVEKLYLETNSKLTNAVHLYESMGFRQLPADRAEKSPYARSNVAMEMYLSASETT